MMAIAGIQNLTQELVNDDNNKQWVMAGLYDENTGLFFLRQGEDKLIQSHFKPMNLNRMVSKKALKQFGVELEILKY